MNKLKKWYSENKDKPLFKAKLLAVFLVFVMIVVQIYAEYRDRRENVLSETTVTSEAETEDEDKENALAVIFDNSKGHIIALSALSIALIAVQQKKKHKLKESRR